MKRASLFAAAFLLFSSLSLSQEKQFERFDFYPRGTYDPSIPTPKSLLGYSIGARYTEHWRIQPYLEGLSKKSNRISWIPYGKTAEGRSLFLATITSVNNRTRLEEVRRSLARLSDPRSLSSNFSLEETLDSTPVVVWLSFNVHGNEASCTEAALALLYQLTAGTDSRTIEILDNAVILIDPCLNPDGRDRYVNWFHSVVGERPNPDPRTAEHREPWPGGRGNHFYFDLNRDWAFLSQLETKARIAAYLYWNPQIHVDFHEMGHESSYFFFPADVPVNPNLPRSTLEWQKKFGEANAAAFDKFGWLYYTGERFDLFYPGYGDSWPSLQGAIGMTYEQAGHSTAGLAVKRKDESILTLHERAWHHFIAAMATLEKASNNRREILSDYYRFFKSALDDGKDKTPQSYILQEGSDPARAAALVGVLLAQGIEVHRALEPFVAGPLGRLGGGSLDREKFPSGTYIILLNQPRRRLANALLEPDPTALDFYFYDVSAWNLPLAFGVEAYWSDGAIEAKMELLEGRVDFSVISSTMVPDEAGYAYLIPWDSAGAPALLYHLTQEGFSARIATREFQIDKTDFPRGTVIVPVYGNSSSLHDRIRALASTWKVPVEKADTGLTERGIDLGSDRAITFRPRKIAVVTGDGVSPTSYGTIRFLLEKENQIEFASLTLKSLFQTDLSPYGVLVFPDGWDYEEKFDQKGVNHLERWVRSGGILLGIGGGAAWATASKSGLTQIELASETKVVEAKGDRQWVRIEEAEAEKRRRGIPGTILAVKLDPAHPISFGYGEGPIYVMQKSGRAFNIPETGTAVGVYEDDPKVAGYISQKEATKFYKKAYLVEVSLGEGKIILFADDPNFRMIWQGLTKLFLNALLLPH